ncbi:DUF1893 domain-containing protein [Dysgonomonas termitidis]|uniref:DUF1893 domain-containing protein n=1 Tax=Dysgonomonas termitidis TaxID=1516126 RepID=A0ABV9KYX1_9BACT
MDLYELIESDFLFLDGASIADKVVGKGAEALLALSRVNGSDQ